MHLSGFLRASPALYHSHFCFTDTVYNYRTTFAWPRGPSEMAGGTVPLCRPGFPEGCGGRVVIGRVSTSLKDIPHFAGSFVSAKSSKDCLDDIRTWFFLHYLLNLWTYDFFVTTTQRDFHFMIWQNVAIRVAALEKMQNYEDLYIRCTYFVWSNVLKKEKKM